MSAANNVLTQNLGTRVNQSQTVAGYTVTVEHAYADSSRVLIADTVHPPATRVRQTNLVAEDLQVATTSGVVLPNRGCAGNSEPGQPGAVLQWFDAAGITFKPESVQLRVTVPWIDGMKQLQGSPTAQASSMQSLPTTGPYGSIVTIRPP